MARDSERPRRAAALRLAAAGLAAGTSGVLLWAAAPPLGISWLAWIALVPAALVSLSSPSSRVARLAYPLAYVVFLELALVPALPFGLAHRQWGEPVLPVLSGDSPVLFVALVAVPLLGLLLYLVRFPYLAPPPGARPAVAAVLVPAASWTALDLLRVKLDPSGLWGPLFLSQAGTDAGLLAQLAGPWLVTFSIVAVAHTIALVLLRPRSAPRALAVAGATTLAVLAVLLLAAGPSGERRLTVAAVQPGYDTSEFELPVLRHFRPGPERDDELAALDLIADLGDLSRAAAALGAELLVWPEAAIWVDPRESESVRAELTGLARETGAAVVVPFFVRAGAWGATAVVTPEGDITPPQPKRRPVWFIGERRGPGDAGAPVPVDRLRLGTMLGIDNQDPASARALAARGADLLASSTHDWRGLALQQRALSSAHAAALAVPIVRADWRVGSAVYDHRGRAVADLGLQTRRGVAVAEVRLAQGRTPYARVGDALGWAALAGAAAWWTLSLLRRSARSRGLV